MFADKLQNPFLKPSPFTATTTSYTSSYTSAIPPAPRFSSYKPYEQPRISALTSVNRTVPYEPTLPSYTSRIKETKDIDVMLSNNPFNRQFYPSFAQSRQYGDVSPNKYSNDASISGRSSAVAGNNYDAYSPLQRYNDISRPSNFAVGSRGAYGESQSRLTPPKKYDNYLSTSSADSAATYINKIYDLEDDRASVNDGKPLGSNPFYRKNLLQKTSEVPIPTNDYDSAALKYAGYKMEDRNQPSVYETKDRAADYTYKPLKEENSYRGNSFGNERQAAYEPYQMKYENTFSNDPKIDEKNYQTSKFMVEDDYRIDPQKYAFKESSSREYDHYDSKPKQSYGNYNQPYNFQEEVPKKNDSSKYLANKYEKPQSKKEFNLDRLDYRTEERPQEYDYPYNSKQNNLPYESDQQRMRFSRNSETDSLNFLNNKNPIEELVKKNPFAGGPKDFSKGGSKKDYERDLQQPLKLASSQVDEYTGPEEMQKKIKENKYQQLGIKKQIERPLPSVQQIKRIESYEEAYGSGPLKSRGAAPIRDGSEQFPKTLQINGTMFHRVELECR